MIRAYAILALLLSASMVNADYILMLDFTAQWSNAEVTATEMHHKNSRPSDEALVEQGLSFASIQQFLINIDEEIDEENVLQGYDKLKEMLGPLLQHGVFHKISLITPDSEARIKTEKLQTSSEGIMLNNAIRVAYDTHLKLIEVHKRCLANSKASVENISNQLEIFHKRYKNKKDRLSGALYDLSTDHREQTSTTNNFLTKLEMEALTDLHKLLDNFNSTDSILWHLIDSPESHEFWGIVRTTLDKLEAIYAKSNVSANYKNLTILKQIREDEKLLRELQMGIADTEAMLVSARNEVSKLNSAHIGFLPKLT